MVADNSSPLRTADVFVVGAGLAGAAAALGFARAGFSAVSCGRVERGAPGRTVALMGRSIEMLRDLGVWDAIANIGAPLRTLRIVDDTGSLFAARPVEFHASEMKLDAFGWNVENHALGDIFAAAMAAERGVARVESPVARFAFSPDRAELTTAEGELFAARLVVGADGRESPTRKAAAIALRARRYDQSALTVLLTHSRDHGDVSTEFHTRQGPFTVVPLPASASGFRSSLVWLMKPDEARRRASLSNAALAGEIETRARGLLGTIRIEGERGTFPMGRQSAASLTGPRLALVGDAAHAFPPIGAQGLNLGLRDVDGLVKAAVAARDEGRDFSGEATLSSYGAARSPDVAARMLAVNGLNLSLLADFAPIDALRGLGLAALANIGPLRRMVMREGLSPALAD
jgi:2-octaprenyl-6-methoxyphenol hydroxylase